MKIKWFYFIMAIFKYIFSYKEGSNLRILTLLTQENRKHILYYNNPTWFFFHRYREWGRFLLVKCHLVWGFSLFLLVWGLHTVPTIYYGVTAVMFFYMKVLSTLLCLLLLQQNASAKDCPAGMYDYGWVPWFGIHCCV